MPNSKNASTIFQAAITKKADKCAKYTDPLAKEDCRTELIALNAERDSVQKIEARFREDVLRLAETFANIPLNSERLRLAKQLFDEGKIREADNILNAKEMQQEGDALLAKKEHAQQTVQLTDSLLHIKADEFALKARLKATDYGDSLRYDSAVIYFEQSRRYAETVDNLWQFADLLGQDNQTLRAIGYYERALQLARSEDEEADLSMNLGIFYKAVQKMDLSEKMYLRSLDIYERLAKSNPAQFEPDLAMTAMNLGNFYSNVQKMDDSEKMYLRSLEIYERLAKTNPAQFEPGLAWTAVNLGIFYKAVQKMDLSEKMYLRSLDIYERLAKTNPAQFEPDLEKTLECLGIYYSAIQNIEKAESFYLRAFEISEHLANINPAQFEPDLALTAMNLGIFYSDVQKMDLSEKMYLRSLEIKERLARSNPAQFEPGLALILNNFGYFQQINRQLEEAKKMYSRAVALRQKAIIEGQIYFKDDLILVYNNMANLCDSFEVQKDYASVISIQLERAECMYQLRHLNPDWASQAADDYNELTWYYLLAKQYKEAESNARKVIEMYPSREWYQNNLAHALLLQRKYQEAENIYLKMAAEG